MSGETIYSIACEMLETTNMEMLSIESVKNFVEEQPHFSDVFTNIIKHYVEKYDAILSSGVKILEGFDRKTSHNVAWNKIVSFWKGNTEAVFVYGTLRNGERANYMLDGSEYCGKFYLKDCSMYNLGSYPGIKEDKGEYVIGEVYFISSEVLRCLDKYEGEGSLYNRKMVDVFNGEEKVECWAYFYAHEVDVKQRMLQPWGASNEKVWYAAYGSNLSEDRFGCYIRRGVCRQNGIYYKGCTDTTKWDASEFRKFPGRLYFGNSSASWDGKGVAFFDENGCQAVQMRLYRITREQFLQVRSQEGKSDSWYGRIVCLGIDDEGTEIYTLTSKTLREENAPADKYLDLIKNALINEGGYTEKTVQSYFSSMTDDGLGENDAD